MNILRYGMELDAPPIGTTNDAAAWLIDQGYRRQRSIAVTVQRERVLLEVWKRESAEDPIAFYHPLITDTLGTDSICLCATEDEVKRLISASKMMLQATLPVVQMSRRLKQQQKRGRN